MTFERKILVGLEDIQAISLECKAENCKRKITFNPDKPMEIPRVCSCGNPWRPLSAASNLQNVDYAGTTFLNSVESLRNLLANNSVGYRIVLEFDEPQG